MALEPDDQAAAARGRITDALAVLAARAAHVAQAQAELDEAKEEVYATLDGCCESLTEPQRTDVARSLYWGQPALHPRRIADTLRFDHEHQMRSVIGPNRTGRTCDDCGVELLQRARSAPPGSVCDACQKGQDAELDAHWEELRLARGRVLHTPVESAAGAWSALIEIVVNHPPAVASQDGWDIHLEDFQTASDIKATHSGQPIETVGLRQALLLLCAADAIATWYAASVDEIVQRRLGEVTFSALAGRVEADIAAAGRRAEQALIRSGSRARLDVGKLLTEFRPSPSPHPIQLLGYSHGDVL